MTWARRVESALLRSLPQSVQARLGLASAENRAIVRGMFWVGFFLLAAKGIALVKEILVAYHYGTSPVVDGYLFVFNLLHWPTGIFLSVVSFVLIPYLVHLRSENPAEATLLQQALVPFTFGLGVVVALLTTAVVGWLVHTDVAGLQGAGKASALGSLPWLAATVALAFMAAIYSTWLMSQQRHANTLLESMPAAGIAASMLMWPIFWPPMPGQDWGVTPLAVGTLLGFALQTLFLVYLCGVSQRWGAPLSLVYRHWNSLRATFGVVLFSQMVLASTSLIDQFFALRMGEGVLATYTYAQRITALMLGMSAIVIGRAMLPVFSGVTDFSKGFDLVNRWTWRCCLAGLLGAALLVVSAESLVRLLFERGEFTAEDTKTVGAALAIMALQLPFYLIVIVIIQWLVVIKKTKIILVAAIAAFVAKLVAALAMFDLDARGLSASTVLLYVVMSTALWFYLASERSKHVKSA